MAYPISDVPRRIVYSGSAGVGPYAFTFEVLANTDLAVYKNSTLLTLTTDYTVSINSGTGTGTVTLIVAATGSDTITIVGDRAIQRTSDFVTGGDLFANTLNDELDAQTIYVQQVDEKADRAIKSRVTDPTTIDMTLPAQSTRATKLLGFNSSGEPVATTSTITQIDAAVSSFVNATGNRAESILYTPESGPDITVEDALRSLQYGKIRNKIINGKMEIAQRGTSFAAANNYTLDRWTFTATGGGIATVAQGTSTVNGEFQRSLDIQITTADTSIAASDLAILKQAIEGYNINDLFGKSFTLSFWVKSSKTGTHCVAFRNSVPDRSYISTYTVNAANTWEYKTITVSGGLVTAGTWNVTNGAGLYIDWVLAAGSTYQTTAGAWQTGNFLATSSQVNCLDTIGNIFAITGVQLEVGSVASPFEHRLYGQELALCQRYYQILYWGIRSYAAASAYSYAFTQSYPVAMRVAPTTIATVSAGTLSNCTVTSETAAVRGAYFQVDSSAAGNLSVQNREVSYSSEL